MRGLLDLPVELVQEIISLSDAADRQKLWSTCSYLYMAACPEIFRELTLDLANSPLAIHQLLDIANNETERAAYVRDLNIYEYPPVEQHAVLCPLIGCRDIRDFKKALNALIESVLGRFHPISFHWCSRSCTNSEGFPSIIVDWISSTKTIHSLDLTWIQESGNVPLPAFSAPHIQDLTLRNTMVSTEKDIATIQTILSACPSVTALQLTNIHRMHGCVLNPVEIAYLPRLSRLSVSISQIAPAVWHIMTAMGIRLTALHTNGIDQSMIAYLTSYEGLGTICVSPPTFMQAEESLLTDFYTALCRHHASSLHELSVHAIYSGAYCTEQYHVPLILACKQLEKVSVPVTIESGALPLLLDGSGGLGRLEVKPAYVRLLPRSSLTARTMVQTAIERHVLEHEVGPDFSVSVCGGLEYRVVPGSKRFSGGMT